MDKTISIQCEGAGTRDLDELIEFQGDLKSLSEKNYIKLKKEILTEGFAFPIHIWTDSQGDTYVIGGHQRIRTLKKMRDEEGYDIPLLPVSIIHARDWKQAKRRVLQDVNQYGKIESQGLYEFITHADLQLEDIDGSFDLPDINMDSFRAEFFNLEEEKEADSKAKTGSKELSEDDFDEFRHKCPKCSFEFD